LALIFISGCFGPTYPKESLDKCVVDLCKDEYGLQVEAKVTGKTIGIYLPIEDMVDASLKVRQSALEKAEDVLVSISRVALSTDAKLDFFCVIAKDPAMPNMELIFIRHIDDIKRFMAINISRGEYFDRMITELRLTPKDNPEIGYSDGKLFVKDLKMGEFLTRQIASRIRKDFLADDSLAQLELKFVGGMFYQGVVTINILTAPREDSPGGLETCRSKTLEHVIKRSQGVIHSYKFEDYTHINIFYRGKKTGLTKEDIDKLKEGNIKPEDLL